MHVWWLLPTHWRMDNKKFPQCQTPHFFEISEVLSYLIFCCKQTLLNLCHLICLTWSILCLVQFPDPSVHCLTFFALSSTSPQAPIRFLFLLDAISYRDLLDFSRVGDDLLHHLHSLALGLCLSLSCCGLDDLHLLALTHLHGHRRTLTERK